MDGDGSRVPQLHLRNFLANQDVPCPSCGYNLRGLQGSTCPECGLELVLAVRLAEPRQGAFITAVVGLACGAGFSGLLLLYFLCFLCFGHFTLRNDYALFVITALPLLVEGFALAAMLVQHGRFQRSTGRTRAILIVGAWMLTAANLAVFMLNVR